MITVKRSCASSNRIDEDRIVFNSFIIELTNTDAARFKMIHKYLHEDDNFDRVLMTRTLEEIIDNGLYEMVQHLKPLQARRDLQ